MINALFLSCALALPASFVPPEGGRRYDVGIFQFLVGHYHKFHKSTTDKADRVYLIGGDDDLLFSIRKAGLEAWRITIDPHTPFDIVAYPNAIPLARESGLVVIFCLEIRDTPWQTMKLFIEATGPLSQGGIIAFYDEMAPYFSRLARFRGYEKIPFQWYDMSIWKKTSRTRGSA